MHKIAFFAIIFYSSSLKIKMSCDVPGCGAQTHDACEDCHPQTGLCLVHLKNHIHRDDDRVPPSAHLAHRSMIPVRVAPRANKAVPKGPATPHVSAAILALFFTHT